MARGAEKEKVEVAVDSKVGELGKRIIAVLRRVADDIMIIADGLAWCDADGCIEYRYYGWRDGGELVGYGRVEAAARELLERLEELAALKDGFVEARARVASGDAPMSVLEDAWKKYYDALKNFTRFSEASRLRIRKLMDSPAWKLRAELEAELEERRDGSPEKRLVEAVRDIAREEADAAADSALAECGCDG